MPTLFLHIGAPKTGSTYIQSSLRLSRESLTRVGLEYPVGMEEPLLGPESLTCGNGYRMLQKESVFSRLLKDSNRSGYRGVIFSSEHIWFDLQDERLRRMVLRTAERLGFNEIRILLFLRNPMEFAVSRWLQSVKSGWTTKGMDAYLADYKANAFYEGAMTLIEHFEGVDGIAFTLLNYSVVRKDLLSEVARWLGAPEACLLKPGVEQVNRSLDTAEVRMQAELNRVLGSRAVILSKALCERITDVKPRKPSPSLHFQDEVWAKTKPWVDRLNRYLPTGQELVFDRMEPEEGDEDLGFSEPQLNTIAESLGGEIARTWGSQKRFMAALRRIGSRSAGR